MDNIVIPAKAGIHLKKMPLHNHTKHYFVYILASGPVGTLYVGVTNNLLKRTREHKDGLEGEFTREHKIQNLVYFETTSDVEAAIAREKQLKKWNREWKIDLIVSMNPQWNDLYGELLVN